MTEPLRQPETATQTAERHDRAQHPYRVDSSLATTTPALPEAPPLAPLQPGALFAAAAVALFARVLMTGAAYWSVQPALDRMPSPALGLVFSAIALLYGLASIARGPRRATRTRALELVVLVALLSAIEALPWTNRVWIELNGFATLVACAIAGVYSFATRRERPTAF